MEEGAKKVEGSRPGASDELEKNREPWEQTVREILGDPTERLRKSELTSQSSDSSISIKEPSDKSGSSAFAEFFNTKGERLSSLDKLPQGEPFVSVRQSGSSKLLEYFSNAEEFRQGRASLAESFSYRTDDKRLVEERSISVGGKSTELTTVLDKETNELTFRTNSGGVKQEISIDADSQLKKFDLHYSDSSLSYQIDEGVIRGLKLMQPGGGELTLPEAESIRLIDAANQSLQTLRRENGLPEPLPYRLEVLDAGSPLLEIGNPGSGPNDGAYLRHSMVSPTMHDALVDSALKAPENQHLRQILADLAPSRSIFSQPEPLLSAVQGVLQVEPQLKESFSQAALLSARSKSEQPLRNAIEAAAIQDPKVDRVVREVIASHLRTDNNAEKGKAVELLMSRSARWTKDDFNLALQHMQPNQVESFSRAFSFAPMAVKIEAHKLLSNDDKALQDSKGIGGLPRFDLREPIASHLNDDVLQARMQLIAGFRDGIRPDSLIRLADSHARENLFGFPLSRTEISKDNKLLEKAFPGYPSRYLDIGAKSLLESDTLAPTVLAETLGAKLAFERSESASAKDVFARLGVKDEKFAASVEAAVKHYGEENLLDLESRVHMFNSLSPEMRERLAGPGRGAPVDEGVLSGLLLNGRLEAKESPYGFLLDNPSLEKKLERELDQNFTAVGDARKSLFAEEDRKDENFSLLDRHTRDGVSALDLIEHGAEKLTSLSIAPYVQPFGPSFDLFKSGVDEFAEKQASLIRQFKEDEKGFNEHSRELQALESDRSQLLFAKSVHDYEKLTQSDAPQLRKDYLGLMLLDRFGPDVIKDRAPNVWKDLAEGGLSRLKELELIQNDRLPEFKGNRIEQLEQASAVAASLERSGGGNLDLDIRRRQVLEVFDNDPSLARSQESVVKFGEKFASFSQLLESANQGTKYEDLVAELKSQAGDLKGLISNVSPEDIQGLKELREALKTASSESKDEAMKESLRSRAESVKSLLDLVDPTSEQHQNLLKTLEDVQSRNLSADTLGNWLRENGPVIAATAASVAIVVGTMGTASPLAVVMVSSAVALGASQGTKEALYLVNHNLFDTGLGGYNDRSYHGAWFAKHGKEFEKLFGASDLSTAAASAADLALSFQKEVSTPLSLEYAQNVIMGLVGLGAVRFGQAGLSGLNTEWVKSLAANPRSLELIQLAGRSGVASTSKPMVSEWLKKIAIESGKEVGQELGEEGVSAVAMRALDQAKLGSPVASVLLAASIGMAQGKMSGRSSGKLQGDQLFINSDVQDNVIESLKLSGHYVESLPDGSFYASRYDTPGERVHIAVLEAAGGTSLLPNARFFASGDGRTTKLEARPELGLPNEDIVKRDAIDEYGWEPSDLSIEVRRTMQEWSKAMAEGDYEKALQIAEAGRHEPDVGGAIPTKRVKVELDYSSLQDIESMEFRTGLRELIAPEGESAYAKLMTDKPSDYYTNPSNQPYSYSVRMAEPVVVIPAGTEIHGKKLEKDLALNLFGNPGDLDAQSREILSEIKKSPAGQRLFAEQSLVAMEERLVHLSQFNNAHHNDKRIETISPTLAQFLQENSQISPINGKVLLGIELTPQHSSRYKEILSDYKEMEVAALLYDSGFSLADIRAMVGDRHLREREPFYNWLSAREARNEENSGSVAHRQRYDGFGIETETDRTIQDYVSELKHANGDEALRIKELISKELAAEARGFAAKLGLVERNAQGVITDYLISEKNLVLVQGKDSFDSYQSDNSIEISLDKPDPTSALWHEMKHMAEMLERTSLYKADPKAFERRLREDVFGELAQGGEYRLAEDADGNLQFVARHELTSFEQRSNLKSLMLDYTAGGAAQSRPELKQWLSNRPDAVAFFEAEGINRDALLSLMQAELTHFDHVRENSILGNSVLSADPKLASWIDSRARHYQEMAKNNNREIYEEPQLHKLTGGLTEEVLGMSGHSGHYNILSGAERRATVVELTRNIQLLGKQLNSEASIESAKESLHFQVVSHRLTQAIAKLRFDETATPANLQRARQAARDLVAVLPDNEASRTVVSRLVAMDLLDQPDSSSD
ncbi:MAG: hypothetical protein K2Y32_03870 [Candidatus Obscuribacterales bacterium]|nr:hypothetical protein [Candidatus Obscuribacterales bacterium]